MSACTFTATIFVWANYSISTLAMFEDGRGGGGGGAADGGGVPDQFRHFIASRSSISLPISFPHHGVAAVVSSPPLPLSFGGGVFDSYPPPPAAALFPPPSHHHQQHQSGFLQSSKTTAAEDLKEQSIISSSRRLLGTNNLVMQESKRSIIIPAVVSSSPPSSDHSSIEASSSSSSSWTNDEVLALLRIRSSMENWFPDFTWEHVSRKLAELGFQRSAEKCKEKFEEESRNFSTNYSNRFLVSDLDEQLLYNHDGDENNPQVSSSPAAVEKAQDNNNKLPATAKEKNDYEKELVELEEGNVAVGIGNKGCDEEKKMILMCRKRRKKRKRAEEEEEEEEFEMFKGFCETIVKKIIGQQEELHNKLIEDMIKRDEESIAREEAWKIQEIDRINKEIEKRSREQAISGDRQAKIIDSLKKFIVTSQVISPSPPLHHQQQEEHEEVDHHNNLVLIKNKFQDLLLKLTNPSNTKSHISTTSTSNNPTSSSSTEHTVPSHPRHYHRISHGSTISTPRETSSTSKNPNEGDTSTRKRWPGDEVLALINLRCNLNNNEDNNCYNKDTGGSSSSSATKGNGCPPTLPRWERISQMMSELGYQRSAKRCKEKWENINKYFRKTKDNKKRSMDSRTCPYFHPLSNLYSQAAGETALVGPSPPPPHNQSHS